MKINGFIAQEKGRDGNSRRQLRKVQRNFLKRVPGLADYRISINTAYGCFQ